jgi:isocitrate dehydrogenase
VRVWPDGLDETFCTDHWRARYRSPGPVVTHAQIAALLTRLAGTGLDFIKVENLCTFDGEPGFSTGQGE